MARSITVREIRIPVDKIGALSPEQRYTYYLLGFIYNELVALRKMASFALLAARSEDQRPVRKNADMSQVLMLFRFSCAKSWEALVKLHSKEANGILRSDVYVHWPEGLEAMKRVNQAAAAANWLSSLRNELAFHYPSMKQWEPSITPKESWTDDVMYIGKQTGNVFHEAADSVANVHLFGERMQKEGRVIQMVDEMIDLLGLIVEFVEHALGVFVGEVIFDGVLPTGPEHKLSVREYIDVRLPFWTSMEKAP